jgi:hypothetical protein
MEPPRRAKTGVFRMIQSHQLTEIKQHLRKLLQEELCLARFSETEEGDFLFHYERMRVRVCFDTDESAYVWMGRPDREGDHAVSVSASFLVEDIVTTSACALERYLSLIKSGSKLFWELHRAATKEEAPAGVRVDAAVVPVVRH